MLPNVVDLTQELIRIRSVSANSNAPVSDHLQSVLKSIGCEIERLEYTDSNGELKVNLIGKLGSGTNGLAFCSHSDTVPGQEIDWPAFDPEIKDGKLYGRGSCDMKGPLAATIIAASQIDPDQLKKPLYILITADEEIGLFGAKYVVEHSEMLKNDRVQYGIIAEPTEMIPVYAHKGGAGASVASHGIAAHSSTDKGVSANFALARFMAEMADLRDLSLQDKQYQDDNFDPPTNGFNMTMTDFDTAGNVTAPKAVCKVGFRTMPGANNEELIEKIVDSAQKYDLEVSHRFLPPLHVSTDSPLVQAAVNALNGKEPETVSYGTDGIYLQNAIPQMVVLGPGSISVAHTIQEHVPIDELEQSVEVYKQIIAELCM
ncbi:MAG: M20/M25/M40 family metallo-hydrolase [Chloroflexota bacterium]